MSSGSKKGKGSKAPPVNGNELHFSEELKAYVDSDERYVFNPDTGLCFAKVKGGKVVPFAANDVLDRKCKVWKSSSGAYATKKEVKTMLKTSVARHEATSIFDSPKSTLPSTVLKLQKSMEKMSEEEYLASLSTLPTGRVEEKPAIETMGGAPDVNDELLKQILSMMTGKPKEQPLAPGVEVRSTEREITGATLTIADLPNIKSFARQPYIDPKDRETIEALLRKSSKQEIELSFGKVVDREFAKGRELFFEPGIWSATAFKNLLCALEFQKEFGKFDRSEKTRDVVEIARQDRSVGSSRSSIRRITTEDGMVIWQEKVRDFSSEILNATWGYRITSSSETNIAPVSNFHPEVIRTRTRTSYISSEMQLRVDCSKIIQTTYSGGSATGESKSFTKYEVEIERMGKHASVASLSSLIELVVKGTNSAEDETSTISMLERQYVELVIESMVGVENKRSYWNKPTNIKYPDLLQTSKYGLTIKLDGVRRFILITKLGTYAIGTPNDVWKIGEGSVRYDGTFIDCEKYEHEGVVTYYAFDLLFYKGADIRSSPFATRLAKIDDAISGIVFFGKERVVKKHYFMDAKDSVYQRVVKAKEQYNEWVEKGHSLDGFIFQPSEQYDNKTTRKWKPASMMTIDFLVKLIPGSDFRYELYVGEDFTSNVRPFKGDRSNPFRGTMYIEGGVLDVECDGSATTLEQISADGTIVECSWDFEKSEFVPERPRDDRDRPNNATTARDVWRDIMRPVQIADLEGNTLKIARVYFNHAKAAMLNQELRTGQSIVDVGSGRFGDLRKWEEVGLEKVFVVDPSKENVKEGLRRYKERVAEVEKMRAEFRPRLPKVEVIKDGKELVGIEDTDVVIAATEDEKINAVVSFFSFTFLAEEQEKMDRAFDTIDRLLGPGGKFFGIVLDRKRVKQLLYPVGTISKTETLKYSRDAKTGFVTYDTPSFTIRQASKFLDDSADVPHFGEAIDIRIKDEDSMVGGGEGEFQREWLVDFDYIVDELRKRKITLAKKADGIADYTYFLDHGKEFECCPMDSKIFSWLNRAFVFERKVRTVRRTEKMILERGELASFGIHYLPAETFYLLGVDSGSSSFIHAVLRSADPKYIDLHGVQDKTEYVDALRKKLAKRLSFEEYQTLEYGQISQAYTIKAKGDVKKGYEMYLAVVKDPKEYVGKNLVGDLLSRKYDINIIALDGSGEVIKPKNQECIRDLFDYKRETAIVVTQDRARYDVLVQSEPRDDTLLYEKKSKIVKKILDHACPKK